MLLFYEYRLNIFFWSTLPSPSMRTILIFQKRNWANNGITPAEKKIFNSPLDQNLIGRLSRFNSDRVSGRWLSWTLSIRTLKSNSLQCLFVSLWSSLVERLGIETVSHNTFLFFYTETCLLESNTKLF